MGSLSRTLLIATQVAVGFFMMPFLLTHLGTRWYGIWTVLSSLIAYFYVMDVGLGNAVQLYCARYIATRDYDNANKVINTALVIYSAISVIIVLITIVLVTVIDHFVGAGQDVNVVALVLLILGINIALEFPMNAFAGIIGAFSRFDLLSYSRLAVLALTTMLTIYFIGEGYSILALSVISLVCGQISNILFFIISRYCYPELRITLHLFELSQVRELANYSAWSMLSSFSALIKFKLQPMVIAFFAGPVMVTHYVVGSRLGDYFRDVLFQATNLSMPILTRYHVLAQEDEMRQKLRFLTKINTILATFGGGMIIVLGKAFIARWLGVEFVSSYPILVVLVVAMAIEAIIDPARITMTAMGKVKFVGILEMIEAGINIVLTIILVKMYGIIGAALGLAIPLIFLKLLWVPQVLCSHIKMATRLLYLSIIPAVVITTSYVGVYGWFVIHYFQPTSYLAILVAGAAALPGYLPLGYLLLAPHERQLMLKSIRSERRAES